MAFLEVKGLKKSYKDFTALNGISFSVEKGEVAAVIGSSGAGKTTLLRCLDFLENADGGEIILDGKMLTEGGPLSEREAREKRLGFGLVFQSFNLFPHFTVKKNVVYSAIKRAKEDIAVSGKGIKALKEKRKKLAEKKAEINAEADALLGKFGLSEKADAYPASLSGGQQQRAAIARAMILRPKILLFDEPTSALDPALTGEIVNVIKDLKSDGATMLIVTHDMAFAEKVSDKIIFVSDGKVVEEGRTEEIFSAPKTEELKNFINSF